MKGIIKLLCIWCISVFCCTCTTDDVNEIFSGNETWNVVNFYKDADWNNINKGVAIYNSEDAGRIISKFTILFSEDGTFKASIQGMSFSGTWNADGKKHTVSFNFNASSTNQYNSRFIESLKNASYYRGIGGANGYLQLFPDSKDSFIQFRHVN